MAEQRGTLLPPISVVAVGDTYAIRDGHHRVSVARARGALTIDAIVGTLDQVVSLLQGRPRQALAPPRAAWLLHVLLDRDVDEVAPLRP